MASLSSADLLEILDYLPDGPTRKLIILGIFLFVGIGYLAPKFGKIWLDHQKLRYSHVEKMAKIRNNIEDHRATRRTDAKKIYPADKNQP
jgi:hypothetical protein